MMRAAVIVVAASAFGGQAMKVTIDQTLVCEFSLPVPRKLIIQPDHSVYYQPWSGHAGLRTIGPWSHAKRDCTGGYPIPPKEKGPG